MLALVSLVGAHALGALGEQISLNFTETAIKIQETALDPDAFVLEIYSDVFTLYPKVGGAILVDWGDDTANETCGQNFTAGTSITCSYPNTDTYLVSVTGNMTAYGDAAGSSTNHSITRVVQWGNTGLYWLENAFDGASNLVEVPDHLPAGTVNLAAAFRGAFVLNDPGIARWDTSKVASFSYTFSGAENFNVDVGGWDTSSAENMHAMFSNATSFDQDIGSWDVSSVYTMHGMFLGAVSFNQDIGGWDVGNVETMQALFKDAGPYTHSLSAWDVSKVSNFQGAFRDSGFNGDISGWDPVSAHDMRNMFLRNYAFDQDISGWDMSSVELLSSMFEDAASLSSDLSAWGTSAATSMDAMFKNATSFSSDLSGWCVSGVASAPANFSIGSSILADPAWGSCP